LKGAIFPIDNSILSMLQSMSTFQFIASGYSKDGLSLSSLRRMGQIRQGEEGRDSLVKNLFLNNESAFRIGGFFYDEYNTISSQRDKLLYRRSG